MNADPQYLKSGAVAGKETPLVWKRSLVSFPLSPGPAGPEPADTRAMSKSTPFPETRAEVIRHYANILQETWTLLETILQKCRAPRGNEREVWLREAPDLKSTIHANEFLLLSVLQRIFAEVQANLTS
jgi:hypothetical protein